MGSRKPEETLAELIRARQTAIDALLKARLEGQSQAAVAHALDQVQQALDALLAARLKLGESDLGVSPPRSPGRTRP